MNESKNKEKSIVLQWHLTAKCDQNCIHCYMYNSPTYKGEIENELDHKNSLKIIDEFAELGKRWNTPLRINFTGGDPLLRKDFFNLIKHARGYGIKVGILGNPYHLNLKTAKKLKKLGIFRYQLSIDGTKKTHDFFRKKGSFDCTIKAIEILNKVDIPSVVMFTLSPLNSKDIFDVIELVAKENVKIFDFARLVPIGNGSEIKDGTFKPLEYRNLLLKILEKYKKLKDKGCKTYFGRKEPLWSLLYYELGLIGPLSKEKEKVYGGCAIGIMLTLLADGTALACRRLPLKVGKYPEESIKDIFVNSNKLNEMRNFNKIKKCKECELVQYCRGCRAMAYANGNDWFGPDPQCWKN